MTPLEMIEEVRELVISGLLTDGSHHKQWYLEQIAEKLGIVLPDNCRIVEDGETYEWEKGIAP